MVRPFGTLGRKRRLGRVGMVGLLLASTALIGLPKAEAAGELIDTSIPGADAWSETAAMAPDGNSWLVNTTYWDTGDTRAHYHSSGGVVDIGSLGGSTHAGDISAAGTVVVGRANLADGRTRAFRWTPDGGIENLGTLTPGIVNSHSYGYGVSGDGTRIVGGHSQPGLARGFVWVEGATGGVAFNEQMYQLDGLEDAGRWEAYGISRDGNYAVGYSDGNATLSLAVRWDLTDVLDTGVAPVLNLGTLIGMNGHSQANDVSADGSVVVGYSLDADGRARAFRWVEGAVGGAAANVQMYDLGSLNGGYSVANAVSGDGAVVVGNSTTEDDEETLAFRWTEAGGMESVADWLVRHGVDVGDAVLEQALAVSDDGNVIGGRMEVGADEDRAYIARVAPGPGSGVMDVAEYNRSLFSVTSVAHAGEFLTWLPMNGVHHRPLMQQGSLADGHCVWATGDFGLHGGSQTTLGLAEVGGCVELFGGAVTAGLGVGTSHSWQALALGGSSRLSGQYVVGEVDWQPDGTPLLLSVTGMLGGWQANIHRGYSNGGSTAYSDGVTGIGAGVIRLRADWLGAATLGNTSINPWLSVAAGRQQIGGFTESGGPFPAHFDAQTLGMAEVRLGVAAVSELTTETTLTTTLEVAHRSGDAPRASGNVVGLFDFSLGGGAMSSTWLRAGMELDHQINEGTAISASVHAATNGRDPSVSGSVGVKMTF